MHGFLYAVACVFVPAAWGIAMFYAFGFVERRRGVRSAGEAPPHDYSI